MVVRFLLTILVTNLVGGTERGCIFDQYIVAAAVGQVLLN